MTLPKKIRIGTRASKLALWQAYWVQDLLKENFPNIEVEIISMTTTGDERLDVDLQKVGGKGLFLKEIEEALLQDKVDIAVHSMKDVPNTLPDGLALGAYLVRENPRDAWVTLSQKSFEELPSGSRVGSSSLRRVTQLKSKRNDLQYKSLRGNVQTRLRKLDEGEYDAIVLASAGLKRLDLEDRIHSELDIVPASGQGVVSIEYREDDLELKDILRKLNNHVSETCVKAERIFLEKLEGGCQTPIGSWVYPYEDKFKFRGFISDIDAQEFIYHEEIISLDNLNTQISHITDDVFLGEKGRKILKSFENI